MRYEGLPSYQPIFNPKCFDVILPPVVLVGRVQQLALASARQVCLLRSPSVLLALKQKIGKHCITFDVIKWCITMTDLSGTYWNIRAVASGGRGSCPPQNFPNFKTIMLYSRRGYGPEYINCRGSITIYVYNVMRLKLEFKMKLIIVNDHDHVN